MEEFLQVLGVEIHAIAIHSVVNILSETISLEKPHSDLEKGVKI